MDKGIRAFARNYFVEQNELRRRGEKFTGPKGNTEFRKEVMCKLMEEFGITLASAATHYNEAFKTVREATPELVSGLGRPEDKKGGRKPKAAPQAVQEVAAAESVSMGDVLESVMLQNTAPAITAEPAEMQQPEVKVEEPEQEAPKAPAPAPEQEAPKAAAPAPEKKRKSSKKAADPVAHLPEAPM